MKAFIILDVQNDFLPGGALPVEKGDIVIPIINKIQEKFDLVVATQDWHPKNHASFASTHPGKKINDHVLIDGFDQNLWPDHCVQGTRGADFPPALNTVKVEAIFRKGTDPAIDSYSGFFDNEHKKRTGLAGYLKEKGAKDLFFGGLTGDYCVNFSILDAVEEGFNCYLIVDATHPLDEKNFPKVLENLGSHGVKIITSSQL